MGEALLLHRQWSEREGRGGNGSGGGRVILSSISISSFPNSDRSEGRTDTPRVEEMKREYLLHRHQPVLPPGQRVSHPFHAVPPQKRGTWKSVHR